MRILEEPDPPFAINIVPMIDVVFSILAFFIMSSLFLTKSQGLPVNLPQAVTAQQQRQVDFTITLDDSAGLFLNRQPISLSALVQRIEADIVVGSHALATIHADEAVPHGQVVAVMDRLRQIKGLRLGIATKTATSNDTAAAGNATDAGGAR